MAGVLDCPSLCSMLVDMVPLNSSLRNQHLVYRTSACICTCDLSLSIVYLFIVEINYFILLSELLNEAFTRAFAYVAFFPYFYQKNIL